MNAIIQSNTSPKISGSVPGSILSVRSLSRAFGGVQALNNVNLEIKRGTIAGLIGPNGSGKTTLFQCVSGIDRVATGQILFNNEEILGLRPYAIYQRGLARTFQISRVFPQLTVLENLIVATRRHDKISISRAQDLLEQVHLQDYGNILGTNLSYGQQKLIEFLRVLMNEPSLILLDEPAAGVNPTLRTTLWEMVRHLNDLGVSFLIIEHNMNVIADLCEQVSVLAEGQIIATGTFQAIRENEQVQTAYFGTSS